MNVSEPRPFLATPLARRVLFGALLVLAFALRWYHLDYRSFVIDEFKTVRALAMPSLDLIKERLSNGHPPLYFIALKIWANALGQAPRTIRALSVVFSLFALVYLFLAARFVWGLECAFWTLLIGALHEEMIWGAQDARPYALFLLATAASIHALVHAMHGGQRRWWVAYGLWCVAGILTHVSFVFLLVGQFIAVGLWLARARRWRGDWAITAALALGFTLLVLFTLKHYNQDKLVQDGSSKWGAVNMLKGSRGIFLGGFEHGLGRLPDGVGVASIVALLIAGGRGSLRRRRALNAEGEVAMDVPLFSLALAWVWGVPLGLILTALFTHGTLTQPRYYAVGAGGATLALAMGLTAMRPRWLKYAFGFICLASLAALTFQWHKSAGTGLHEAFEYIGAHKGPEELLVLRMSESATVADYYDVQSPHTYTYATEEEKRITQALRNAAKTGHGFWLVKLQFGKEKYPIGKEMTELMQTRFQLDKDQIFNHAHVWHYVVAP